MSPVMNAPVEKFARHQHVSAETVMWAVMGAIITVEPV